MKNSAAWLFVFFYFFDSLKMGVYNRKYKRRRKVAFLESLGRIEKQFEVNPIRPAEIANYSSNFKLKCFYMIN
jgi:hypothetical protein